MAVLPFGHSQMDAEKALQGMGKPGFYRLVQTQRIIWCEADGSGLRLRKSHASSPQGLREMQEIFDRNAGRYAAEEVQATRRSVKRNRQKTK
ncbi:MAG: hypothetical protein JO353_14190 [Phycisphaerae bacterium]|nr:hypothetical protein [Phycisphaerae bacterium]